MRAWLKKQGFKKGDLRSAHSRYPRMHPLGHACHKGELNVCKWLHNHGAAPDVTKAMLGGWTPRGIACRGGHLSVSEGLFEVGAAEDITKAAIGGFSPMLIACINGHLSVCKWLFEVGAAEDITKASDSGYTPMWIACRGGHLSVSEWLFEVGAAADITRADNHGTTPMLIASKTGHLSVCQWLFEVGASITTAANDGATPMKRACQNDRMAVCKWLVSAGALNSPAPIAPGATSGHVDQAIVQRDTNIPVYYLQDVRPKLLAWAQDVVATHRTFLHVVLRASVILPDSHQQASPDQRCHLPRLPRVVLERLGDLLGVEMVGRRVRNAREFAEALVSIGVTPGAGETTHFHF